MLAIKMIESGGVAVIMRRCNGAAAWGKIVGPDDHVAAKRESPNSLVATYGEDIVKIVDDVSLIFGGNCNEEKVKEELMNASCYRLVDIDGGREDEERAALSRGLKGRKEGGVAEQFCCIGGGKSLKQEGIIDGTQGKKFLRKEISLNERCVKMPRKIFTMQIYIY